MNKPRLDVKDMMLAVWNMGFAIEKAGRTLDSMDQADRFRAIADLQVQRVYEWGLELCPHVHHVLPNRRKHACDVCWEELHLQTKPLEPLPEGLG